MVINFVKNYHEVSKSQQGFVSRNLIAGQLHCQSLGERLDADHSPQAPFQRLRTSDGPLKVRAQLCQHTSPTADSVEKGGLQVVATQRVQINRGGRVQVCIE